MKETNDKSKRPSDRLKGAEEEILQQSEFLKTVLESLTHPFYVIDASNYTIKMANSAANLGRLTGTSTCYALTHNREEPCGSEEHVCPLEIIKKTKKPVSVEHIHYDKEGNVRNVEFRGFPVFDSEGNVAQVIEYTIDITKRKQAEQQQLFAGKVLECINQKSQSLDVIRDILNLIKEFTSFDAVGIRLSEGDDFPYFEVSGFEDDFVKVENYLCARNEAGGLIYDSEGNPLLECMCGNIIRGRTDPTLPFFTEGGSFWTNSTTELLAKTPPEDLQIPVRGRCNKAGYESVALIPLRSSQEIVGLLQLNDKRPGCFTPEFITFFEGIGASIGIALARIRAEENIKNLARFPSENPNPVLRITKDGALLYANDSSRLVLGEWNCDVDDVVPDDWRRTVFEVLCSGKPKRVEAKLAGRVFAFVIAPVAEAGYVNLYGRDITERKQAEEALKGVKRELTIRNKIAETFLTIPDEQIFGEVLQVILEAMESKFGIFGYIDEHGVLLIPSMTRDIWEKCQIPDKTIVYPPEKWGGIWGRALVEKRSLFANQGLHVPEGHIPITRALVVPVIYAGQVIGLLEVANKSTDYSHKDQEFLETIAGKIAPILDARLQRDREERERKQTEEALRRARNGLEQRVKERTSELDEANEQLRQKIEELMHSEEELRNSQILLREKENVLLEAQRIAHLGNWDWDIAENKLWWSDEVYRIFGVEPQQFGATYDAFLSYVHPDDRKLVKQAANKTLRDPTEHYSIEHRVVQPDGSQRIVHERGEVTFDEDGKAVRMIGTVNDITERRKAEQEAQRLREEYVHIARVAAMGELTASLAHELKQPLAAIRSNAQAAQRFLAKEKPDFDELREILLDIIKDNRRADDVIGRLRTLMRKSELQITELNINDVIREIIPLINSYEVMRNVSLAFELDEKILPIAGDRVQLQQVILNLVLNASEALMNMGKDFRKIVLRTIQKDPQYVTVAIKDSGPGIDERILERLFEPFYTTKQEGLGMGLSISRSIIDVLGGNLWAENNPDRGATFYFTIPVFKGGSK